jgi:crooked neck
VPELLWKAYIDFEVDNDQIANARAIYKRLLERTKHVRVWISFAKFEVQNGNVKAARMVFKEAFICLKLSPELQQQRVLLIESWRDFEEEFGDDVSQKYEKCRIITITRFRIIYIIASYNQVFQNLYIFPCLNKKVYF